MWGISVGDEHTLVKALLAGIFMLKYPWRWKNSVFRQFSRSATSILSILWLSAFSASHIFLKMVPKLRSNIQTKLQHNMNYSYKLSQYLTEKFIFWSNVNFKERQKTTFNQMNATKIMFFGKWSKKLWPLINVLV